MHNTTRASRLRSPGLPRRRLALRLCVHQGDVDGARGILKEAFKSINSESIWLAAVKLESENKEYERARILLAKARDNVNTERVWLKSAVLDRQLGKISEARELLNTARDKFPTYAKLWMISGQIEEGEGDLARAREIYNTGVRGARWWRVDRRRCSLAKRPATRTCGRRAGHS